MAAEDRLGYNEPPDWLNPGARAAGRAVAASAGRYADAEKRVPRRSGEERRQSAIALRAVSSLEGQKKAAATEAKASFDKAWAGADVALGDDLYGARR